jgi:predicted RNA binding protein YcfA (HicA-like mRNA interferase family)
MSKLPRLSGQECVNKLIKAGFIIRRQRGSHTVMRRSDPYSQVVVPDHKELDSGTLRAIIRHADLGIQEFILL